MRENATFTTSVVTFKDEGELLDWLRDGKEARAVLGEKLCHLKMNSANGGVYAVELGQDAEDCGMYALAEGDLSDLLDNADVVGVEYSGSTDADYSRFGVTG